MDKGQAQRLTVRREIAATPAELFDAWLDPARLTAWMKPGDAKRSTITADARVGGEFEVMMQTPRGRMPHTGAYQVIDRPRRIAFTWNSDAAGEHNSLVTLDFAPAGRGTEVVLTHENLPAGEVEGHTQGWGRVLDLMAQSY